MHEHQRRLRDPGERYNIGLCFSRGIRGGEFPVFVSDIIIDTNLFETTIAFVAPLYIYEDGTTGFESSGMTQVSMF